MEKSVPDMTLGELRAYFHDLSRDQLLLSLQTREKVLRALTQDKGTSDGKEKSDSACA